MKLEVLISCMHQTDTSIIKRSNISSDALIINQCDKNDFEEFLYLGKHTIRMISTTERGLSRSRNMAIKNAKGDICLISDDDQIFENNYNEKIMEAYKDNPMISLIIFALGHKKGLAKEKCKVNYLNSLRIGSNQISFRKDSINNAKILFDSNFGSGTGNGGGEENLFLYECLKKKLRIIYLPVLIGFNKPVEGSSVWFHGFTPQYFINRGKMTNKLMGKYLSSLYAIYFVITKYPLYKEETSMYSALKFQFIGIFQIKN